MREVNFWDSLTAATLAKFLDSDGLLNEFALMYAYRHQVPLHFLTFKRSSAHKAHKGNTENMFSRSGRLSDPNKTPGFLAKVRTQLEFVSF